MNINTESYNKGIESYQNGNYELTIQYMNKAMEENPMMEFLLAYKIRAFAYSNTGKRKEAIDDFNFVLKHITNEIEVFYARGINYKLIGNYEKAVEDFHTCLTLNYNHDNSHLNLQKIYAEYQENNKLTQALSLLNGIIKIKSTPDAISERNELLRKIERKKIIEQKNEIAEKTIQPNEPKKDKEIISKKENTIVENIKADSESDFGSKILKYALIGLVLFTFITCSSRKRIGAKCRDGSTSYSTNVGTCSHHNGVSSWKYEYWWD
ncbi:DUF3761 domain-containing protein [Tenacibaculum finnmarkense]|uniref:hypothetical protein n=1 Tax=Tenacibaculum finnmarkense TaxID=2781243 RepID=UPI001EFA4DDF|nr:hypothetical protein [Tenacibaculum finnmarkense]MCG8806475.1 DUF3761 domain-containing protein [Tenacibaculum finnmarkense]MCG8857566.1 DUF3761 domain-containing protein [Tenacibaculum finnmarkense]